MTLSVLVHLGYELRDLKDRWFARRADEGQGLAEYALILTLIAIASILVLAFIGSQISGALSWIGSSIDANTP
jgi:Flp pilus assembly pilin Flp